MFRRLDWIVDRCWVLQSTLDRPIRRVRCVPPCFEAWCCVNMCNFWLMFVDQMEIYIRWSKKVKIKNKIKFRFLIKKKQRRKKCTFVFCSEAYYMVYSTNAWKNLRSLVVLRIVRILFIGFCLLEWCTKQTKLLLFLMYTSSNFFVFSYNY